MPREREVPRKKYPPEMSYTKVMKEMMRLDLGFHALMAILLVTGLVIDLLGPWLGGWLYSVRSIAHGYVGALYILVFIVYFISAVFSKRFRMVLTVTNYVDFLFYIILIISGVTIASQNRPWIDLLPGLSAALSPIARNAPMLHTTTTYVWIVFSTIFPGGFLHGLACVYLFPYLKKKYKTMR